MFAPELVREFELVVEEGPGVQTDAAVIVDEDDEDDEDDKKTSELIPLLTVLPRSKIADTLSNTAEELATLMPVIVEVPDDDDDDGRQPSNAAAAYRK